MGTMSIRELCHEVEHALAAVKNVRENDVEITLAVFWRLQDTLNRLTQLVDDDRTESLCVLERDHRSLVRRAVEVLESAERRQLTRNAGIQASVDAINHSLQALAQLRHYAVGAGN